MEVVEPYGNSDQNGITFILHISGKVPRNSNMAIFDFKRRNFFKRRNIAKKKLKGIVKRVKSVEKDWRLLKMLMLVTQVECTP